MTLNYHVSYPSGRTTNSLTLLRHLYNEDVLLFLMCITKVDYMITAV